MFKVGAGYYADLIIYIVSPLDVLYPVLLSRLD